jgi:hypothetical protein
MRKWIALVAMAILGSAFSCGSEGDGTNGTGGTAAAAAHGGAGGGQGGSGGTIVTCVPGLQSIALTPADQTVQLDGVSAAPITFTATGTYSDNHSEPVDPTRLAWSVSRDDDTPPGTISAGVMQPNPAAGGVVTVTATDTCVSGSTTVIFHLDVTTGTPSDPGAWAGDPVEGGNAPLIVYPSDQTRFPRNLYRTLFQWRSQGFTEFRLIFTGPNSTVTVYTDGEHGLCSAAVPAAGCWEVDELHWNYIAGSNAGATATWLVDALDTSTNPPTVRRSASIEIGFSQQDVEGAIFYWSTTSAGVRRGRISQQDPEDYIVGKPPTTYANDVVQCVACHVVSRDGKYLAAGVKSEQTDSLWVTEVTADAPPTPLVTDIAETNGHGFSTISPDDKYVVVSYRQDHMWMVDRATGAFVNDLPTQTFGGGTHPDFRPDGSELVFASKNGDAPGGSSLVLIPFQANDGSWGQPAALLAPAVGLSNLFPMFSPNGQWIAFASGKGGHDDKTAQLNLVAESGGTPIELVNANRVVSNQTTDGQHQNSQPTWAPPGDYDWIAFNSKRSYGVVLPMGTQQIWIAAVDLSKAGQGQDASYPAFRVPFQGLHENNHRAYWTLDVGQGGSGGAGGGGQGGAGGSGCSQILGVGETCDPLNDCCETASWCDTLDDGQTYVCVEEPPY